MKLRWKCNWCEESFETRDKKYEHLHEKHQDKLRINIKDKRYINR